jgi:hypothetical protein
MSPTGVKVVPHVGYKDLFCCTPQHFPRSVEAPPTLYAVYAPNKSIKLYSPKQAITIYNLQNIKQKDKKKMLIWQ